MHQHMQSQAIQPSRRRPLELHGYNTVIHLGYVASPERFGLAIQALNKTRRFWPGGIQLIVAIEDRGILPWLEEAPNCSFHAPAELQDVLHGYRKSGSLLFPDQNESAGDATLHALASGVPLDALNFRPRQSNACDDGPRHGDAFLAIGQARNRTN